MAAKRQFYLINLMHVLLGWFQLASRIAIKDLLFYLILLICLYIGKGLKVFLLIISTCIYKTFLCITIDLKKRWRISNNK